jgi:hypothetical protein
MKRSFVLILLILITAVPALAWEETLIGGDIESGGYGAVVVKYGTIDERDAVFVGGQGGWIVNHSLVIGGAGYGLANSLRAEGTDCLYLGFGYGGLMLEYIVSPQKLYHLSLLCVVGGGGITYYDKKDCWGWDDCGCQYDTDAFFVAEPAVNLMLNLHRYVRVGVGASYRYVDGANYRGLESSDLSGPTAQVMVKFGVF